MADDYRQGPGDAQQRTHAANDVGGTLYHRIKLAIGIADAVPVDLSESNPMPTRSVANIGETMHAMGERESMGTTPTGEDIWRGNQLTAAGSGAVPDSHTKIPAIPDAGELMTIVSENDADNGASATGVLTVMIHYIDPAGAELTTIVTMDGTTPVDIPVILMRFINDIHAETVGSNGVAEGHIKIYKTGSAGLVYNMIEEGGNMSLVPHRMVPFGKTLYIKNWYATEAKNKRCAFRIRSTDNDGVLKPGVFTFKGSAYLNQSAIPLIIDIEVPALSIIKVSGWPDAVGAEGSTGWFGKLVDA